MKHSEKIVRKEAGSRLLPKEISKEPKELGAQAITLGAQPKSCHGRSSGEGGGVEEKTNLGEGPGEQPNSPPPIPFHMHTHFILSVEPLYLNRKLLQTRFFLRASEGNLPQIVVSEILAFLT